MISSVIECGDPYGVEAVAVAVTLSALERGERAIILAPPHRVGLIRARWNLGARVVVDLLMPVGRPRKCACR